MHDMLVGAEAVSWKKYVGCRSLSRWSLGGLRLLCISLFRAILSPLSPLFGRFGRKLQWGVDVLRRIFLLLFLPKRLR